MAPAELGLCAQCVHARLIGNRRGSRFLLCQRAKTMPGLTKYPQLPVLTCPGFGAVSGPPPITPAPQA